MVPLFEPSKKVVPLFEREKRWCHYLIITLKVVPLYDVYPFFKSREDLQKVEEALKINGKKIFSDYIIIFMRIDFKKIKLQKFLFLVHKIN